MMEVTQNVELKELPTDGELLRSIAAELEHEPDEHATPDIETAILMHKSTVDEQTHNGLEADDLDTDIEATPPINSISKEEEEVPAKERDAGSGLDALDAVLVKISSSVDCDPKDSIDDETEDQSSPAEKIAVEDIDNKIEGNAATDDSGADVIEQKEEKHDNSVEEIPSADIVEEEEEDSEKRQNKEIINESEAEEKVVENDIKDGEISTGEMPEATATARTDLDNSNNEEFMDALETISSSDEFEAIADEKLKEPVPEKESIKDDLEEISSEDEQASFNEEINAEQSVINLDTSEECVDADEGAETLAGEQDMEKVKANATDGGEMEVDESEEKKEKVQMTGTQEMKDKSIDDILIEASETCETNSKDAQQTVEGSRKESEVPTEAANKTVATDSNGTLDEELMQAAEQSKLAGQSELEASEKGSKVDGKDTVDSDDEVIFLEPIQKSAKVETDESKHKATMPETAKKEDEVAKEEDEVTQKENEVAQKEDEVVLVSEDEDESLPPAKPAEEAPSKNVDSAAASDGSNIADDLSADNSDNACDQFEKPKADEKTKGDSAAGEDMDSNSSNLLQPSQKSRDAPAAAAAVPETEPEPEAESNAADLAEADGQMAATSEPEHEEDSSASPAIKRMRLSIDDKAETTTTSTSNNDEETLPAVGKRSHILLSNLSAATEKEETPSKKLKTDDSDSNSSSDGTLQIDLDAHDNTQSESEMGTTESLTLELQPKPELKSEVKPFRLEFVKCFRKSFDKMTRHDLEELVLQKVVESMLVKSEFAEIRRQVDSHEATLANYRRKIAEVSKQYLDLETVHKRVLKDLETKNAHFTAPVRITRAVGLQVGMALMKKPSDEARNHHTAGSMPAPVATASTSTSTSTMSLPAKVAAHPSTSPLRSAMRPGRPAGSRPQQTTEQQHLQQQQHLQHQQQQQQPAQLTRSSLPFVQSSSSGSNSLPVRRGCLQKVTPQRPVNNNNNNSPASQQQSPGNQSMQRIQPVPGSSSSQRTPMFASKHTSIATTAIAAAAAAVTMRARGPAAKPGSYGSAMAHKQQLQQQPLP
ncbi:GH23846 [Drosophila grimshawi]|uniref:GH23846 n=1 Tax=Drosophila grimshawi TaxID=7222 RepID=B4K0S6_DROGR|nr:GH23846 [Drosophila grimshawi]